MPAVELFKDATTCNSLFPSLYFLSLLWDGRRTQCGDQQYRLALISPLNKLVAFY